MSPRKRKILRQTHSPSSRSTYSSILLLHLFQCLGYPGDVLSSQSGPLLYYYILIPMNWKIVKTVKQVHSNHKKHPFWKWMNGKLMASSSTKQWLNILEGILKISTLAVEEVSSLDLSSVFQKKSFVHGYLWTLLTLTWRIFLVYFHLQTSLNTY